MRSVAKVRILAAALGATIQVVFVLLWVFLMARLITILCD